MFGEPTQEFPAGVLIDEGVEELVHAIDDVDHELFHFLIIEAGETGPGNRAKGTGDRHIHIVAGGG